ncbi:hypothetical protein G3N58_17685 [Paraburkholderia sp. Ac-20342]|nr:hypothetical protein [Paraburkholderia sp. Ac-20342]MBN3848640.1 hypothetical protein [Paraburkholderia sp. Ac-20342]
MLQHVNPFVVDEAASRKGLGRVDLLQHSPLRLAAQYYPAVSAFGEV